MKIVVFDLDETLGYFTEYGIFWDCLVKYFKMKNKQVLTQTNFNNILDLFPEFLRPNIINILTYLKTKKQSKCCHKMMIYTNNQGPKEWANHITEYFEDKLKYKLFDQIIAAFKINGKSVEICRTSHNKSYEDFIKCTKIPSNTEICFLDDTYYPEMINDNIFYINVKPYVYDLNIDYMINKFEKSKMGIDLLDNETDFNDFMLTEFKKYNYSINEKDKKEYDVDLILGKQIIFHLQEFFNKSKKNKSRSKSRKNVNLKKNKTMKK
jgi:hypothetical protein